MTRRSLFLPSAQTKRDAKSYVLWEFTADPGCSVQHLADPHPLHVPCEEMGVVQQSGHLGHGKAPDGFDPDGHVEHLRGDEVAVPRSLQPGQLHQDTDVPVGQSDGGEAGNFSWKL